MYNVVSHISQGLTFNPLKAPHPYLIHSLLKSLTEGPPSELCLLTNKSLLRPLVSLSYIRLLITWPRILIMGSFFIWHVHQGCVLFAIGPLSPWPKHQRNPPHPPRPRGAVRSRPNFPRDSTVFWVITRQSFAELFSALFTVFLQALDGFLTIFDGTPLLLLNFFSLLLKCY